MTPMDRPEYVRIKFTDIPKEFVDEYDLTNHIHNGWVYFEIVRGCYGLPQSGKLANDLLRTRLNKAGYYEAATTMGLWRHKWRPIMFVLIVDDFGIEYVGTNMSNICRNSCRNTMRLPPIGRERNLQASTLNGTMRRSIWNAPVACACKSTSATS